MSAKQAKRKRTKKPVEVFKILPASTPVEGAKKAGEVTTQRRMTERDWAVFPDA